MAEIGVPVRRRVLVPQTVPDEPYIEPPPKTKPLPQQEPAEPEKVN